MSNEVEHLIDGSDPANPPRFLAHQTASDPFDLPSPGWNLLEQLSNSAYASLATENFQRWRSGEFHLRRWAIRFGRLSPEDKARLHRDGLHNHLPALFSSIYYLRVPQELEDEGVGGTMFINPYANVMDVMSPRSIVVPAKEGRLVIFPSFVDHAPVPIDWDATGVPRIVVSSDVFYVSGEAAEVRGPIVKAAPAEY